MKSTGFADIENSVRDLLKKRAERKFSTNRHLFQLINECKDSPLHKSYLTSTFCTSKIVQTNGKVTSAYCGQRWCNVCNSIRTGKLIDWYAPQLKQMYEPFMLVLSRPNVNGKDLKAETDLYIKTIQKIVKKCNKYFDKVHGVRKFEVTFNINTYDFHPHFHFLVSSEQVAAFILKNWLEIFPTASASQNEPMKEHLRKRLSYNKDFKSLPYTYSKNKKYKSFGSKGNQMYPAYNGFEHELFKYMTKPTAKTNQKQLIDGKKEAISIPIPAKQLDTILNAMRGRRVFQTHGKIIKELKEEFKIDEAIQTEKTEHKEFLYCAPMFDWVDIATGELVTGFKPKKFDIKLNAYNVKYFKERFEIVNKYLMYNNITDIIYKKKKLILSVDGTGKAEIFEQLVNDKFKNNRKKRNKRIRELHENTAENEQLTTKT